MKKLVIINALFVMVLLQINIFSQSDYLSEHVIEPDFDNACSISGYDVDGDDDIDFAATSFDGSYISWFENDGYQNFTEHVIIENFGDARVLDFAFIDEDDDIDIVATAIADNKISWFENDGNGNFTEHVIVTDWTAAGFVMAYDHSNKQRVDFDGDGDTDILATAINPGNRVSWFENDGSQNFTEHIVKENWYWARYSCVVDIDFDGDQDFLSTAKAGDIILFENDGTGNFTESIVISNWGETSSVQAADIDKDGDIDLAGTSVTAKEVAWFENDGSQNFTQHVIKNNFNGAFSVAIADMNNDDELDIVADAWISGLISVFENDGNQNFSEYLFCDHAYEMIKIFVVDLDGDSDNDVLGACYATDDLRWWENLQYHLSPSFEVDNNTGNTPLTLKFLDSSTSDEAITSWKWDFNDDGIFDSYEQNPTWTYNDSGTYSVTLWIESLSKDNFLRLENYITVLDGECSLNYRDKADHVEIPSTEQLDLTKDFSIVAYIQPVIIPHTLTGITLLDKESLKIFIPGNSLLTTKEKSVAIEYIDSTGQKNTLSTVANVINTDCWQQVAVCFDNGNESIKVYVNGVNQELSGTGGIAFDIPIKSNLDNALVLGNDNDFKTGFNGMIDELRIWNYARTENEIKETLLTKVDSNNVNLIAYYDMNEGNGTLLKDHSSYKNHADIINCIYTWGIDYSTILGVDIEVEQDNNFTLYPNYPNPFNPLTNISYQLNDAGKVQLIIYDVLGRMVDILVDEIQPAGNYTVAFNGNHLTTGIYFYQIKNSNFVETKKMVLLK